MPSQHQSPYASSFLSAIKKGTPCLVAVEKIASRCKKTPNMVFLSLFKAGLCDRQKFNGQWLYWPCEGRKCSATLAKGCQLQTWQCFIDWCIGTGCCTPEQLSNNSGSQKDFMDYCRKFFNRQSGSSVGSKPRRRRTTKISKTRGRKTTSRAYKFPSSRSTTTRRYRRAA